MKNIGCGIVCRDSKVYVFGGYGAPQSVEEEFFRNEVVMDGDVGWSNVLYCFDLTESEYPAYSSSPVCRGPEGALSYPPPLNSRFSSRFLSSTIFGLYCMYIGKPDDPMIINFCPCELNV